MIVLKEEKRGFSFYRLFLILGLLSVFFIILIVLCICFSDDQSLSEVFGERSLVHSETV